MIRSVVELLWCGVGASGLMFWLTGDVTTARITLGCTFVAFLLLLTLYDLAMRYDVYHRCCGCSYHYSRVNPSDGTQNSVCPKCRSTSYNVVMEPGDPPQIPVDDAVPKVETWRDRPSLF